MRPNRSPSSCPAPTASSTLDEEYDVVVVGFGAAGASAAVEAASAGARVLVLDRFKGGGASARSGGSYYAGGGTPTQLDVGFMDSPQEMLRYLSTETGGAVGADVLRAFCDESRDNLAWLSSLGLTFEPKLFSHKTTHPPSGYGLYYSGNEQQYARHAAPAPRGHVPAGAGMTGSVLFGAIAQAARAEGVVVRQRSQAVRLLTRADGTVEGVEVLALPESPLVTKAHDLLFALASARRSLVPRIASFERAVGRTYCVRVRRGVVIAAGGFVFNEHMVKDHARPYLHCMPLGTPGDDGAGIRLGQTAGGALVNMDECAAWRFIYPPEAFVSGVLVGSRGQRICDESLYGATLCRHVAQEPDGRAWLVIDQGIVRRVRSELGQEERLRDHPLSKLISGELNALVFRKYSTHLNLHVNRHKADSVAELERACRLPDRSLAATLARYNERIASRMPDELGKADRYRQPIVEAPYLAINCDLGNQLFLGPCITLGGLRTNGLTSEVLREDGVPLPGLYAAGRSAAGICAGGYVSGLSLADCVFSGRRAGRHAAKRAGDQAAAKA